MESPLSLYFLLAFAVPVIIGLLLYYIPKKMGYAKKANFLVWGYITVIFVTVIICLSVFDKKTDIKNLLWDQSLTLRTGYKILKEESSSAIGDYYHNITLEISEYDKEQLIEEIQLAKGFRPLQQSQESLIYQNLERNHGKRQDLNYETEFYYIREYFQPSGEDGVAPTFRRISVSKTENKLVFEDIIE